MGAQRREVGWEAAQHRSGNAACEDSTGGAARFQMSQGFAGTLRIGDDDCSYCFFHSSFKSKLPACFYYHQLQQRAEHPLKFG